MTQLFIDTYGWQGAMLLIGGLNLHFVVAAALLRPTQQIQAFSINSKTYESLEDSSKHQETDDNSSTSCLDIINVSLLKNGAFIVVLIVTGLTAYAYNGWVIYLISFAQSKGLSQDDAAIVAIISGLGALVVRLLMATLPGKITPRLYLYVGSVLVMLSYVGFYFATSFLTVSFASFCLGVGLGITGTQAYVAANATIRTDEAVSAVAWIHVFLGAGYIISGYVTGWLYDLSDNFQLSWIELSAVSSL
ncbi:monocarboxylate transporter 12-like [Amphiura filiformis]|uniref:monocarboxylate transporter 12-like n=1 Tax=Amphiura filiformis TaxID=82378 RepID=UPI003B219091